MSSSTLSSQVSHPMRQTQTIDPRLNAQAEEESSCCSTIFKVAAVFTAVVLIGAAVAVAGPIAIVVGLIALPVLLLCLFSSKSL